MDVSGWWLASYLLLWGIVVLLGVTVVALARHIGTLHLRLSPTGALEIDDEGPPLGEAPPEVSGTATDGRPVSIGGLASSLRDRRDDRSLAQGQLVMFVSPGCRVCEVVAPSLEVVAAGATLEPIFVTDMDPEETALAYADKMGRVPVVPGKDIVGKYDVPGTPYIIVFDRQGVVRAKGTVNNLEQVEGLVDTARHRLAGVEMA